MADIIELLERRDESGLALLKEKYADYCYSIIYHLLRDHEQTEEALSDVFLRIWNSIPPARPLRLRAYLAKTARNIALDYIKRNSAEKRSAVTVLLDELAECIPDGSGSEDLASNIDLTDAINRFLRNLPIEQRRVFIKRYWYMSSIADTAISFGMSESKVTSILFRVRNKLKEHLTKEGFDL